MLITCYRIKPVSISSDPLVMTTSARCCMIRTSNSHRSYINLRQLPNHFFWVRSASHMDKAFINQVSQDPIEFGLVHCLVTSSTWSDWDRKSRYTSAHRIDCFPESWITWRTARRFCSCTCRPHALIPVVTRSRSILPVRGSTAAVWSADSTSLLRNSTCWLLRHRLLQLDSTDASWRALLQVESCSPAVSS
jgi:hypothetical protein